MNLLDAIYGLAAGVLYPVWSRKTRGGWSERFGNLPALPAPSGGRPRLLLHAVSVGETNALRHLVPLLGERADVVISAGTDTGLARARDLYGSSCSVVRYPLDFSRSVRRFLDAVRPDAVGLVELEVWPNFVGECSSRGIPVGVINGRLSERSYRGYRMIRPFMRHSFERLTFAAVQDESYRERFLAMGVAPDRCVVTGSMKWDSASITDEIPGADDLAIAMGIDRSRPLVVAGSTGPGEEHLLHEACPRGVQLLCAPRKVERFEEAAAALPGCVRRTAGSPGANGSDRFLLDTIGELRKAYALATVVVVGRSFGSQYGSDPIEPIGLGKATVIGPSVSDFTSIVAAFLREGGIVQAGPESLGSVLSRLLESEGERRELAERGRACIRGQQGASGRNARIMLGWLAQRG